METIDQILDAPAPEERRLQYAGFGIRLAAYLIDGVLLWVVNFFFGLVLSNEPVLSAIISLCLGIAYFSFMESSDNQATLGKMAVGIKVGNARGEQIGFANALGRYFGKILSSLTLLIGFLMAAWDDKHQALHDKLASTYVFYANK